jgi:hypothetical protein
LVATLEIIYGGIGLRFDRPPIVQEIADAPSEAVLDDRAKRREAKAPTELPTPTPVEWEPRSFAELHAEKARQAAADPEPKATLHS